MIFELIKSKLFEDYLKCLCGRRLSCFQFDKKIIFYKNYSDDIAEWVLYIDLQDNSVFIINEQKSYPVEVFIEKLHRLKAFL